MKRQDVPVQGCCDRTGELADRAHENGEVFYLTRNGRRLAAIVPVGNQSTAAPEGALAAAREAGFGDLPHVLDEAEVRRRLTAALNAAYPHMADLPGPGGAGWRQAGDVRGVA